MADKKKRGCFSGCGAVLLLCVIGCAGLMIVGRDSAQRQRRQQSPAPASEDAKSTASTTAMSAIRIPGLKPVDVYLNYTNLGFSKTGPKDLKSADSFDEYRYYWKCEQKNGFDQLLNTVEIYGDTPSTVTSVSGSSLQLSEKDRSDFLSHVATIPFDGNDQAAARQWVRDHMSDDKAVTTFGGVKFELSKGRILRIGNGN